MPRLFEDFTKSDEDNQDRIAKYMASYILLKHVQNGSEKSCVLENMLHYLCEKNLDDRLVKLLNNKDTKIMYLDSPISPIAKAKMQTFKTLLNHLKTLQLKDKLEIFTELDA